MKTSSRKRLLISSVAMLLVAMLALGTATFAWFTQNTTSTADGIAVKTAKTSTLEISKKNKEWGTYVNYNHTKTMFPASTTTGSTFVKAVAADSSASTLKAGTIESASGDSYYYAEQLNIRNAGDGTVNDVTITISNLKCNYGRIALVPVGESAANELGAFAYPEGKAFKDYVYDTDGAAYDGLTNVAGNVVNITPDSTMTIDIGDLGSNEAKYFNLYIWFEGQDADCKDANAGKNLDDIANADASTGYTGKLTFTVEGVPDDSSIQ